MYSHYICGPLQIQKRVEIETLKERFGCRHITLVGDKGMIKSGEIEDLKTAGFHYITSITKSQIKTLPEVLPYRETHVATRKKLNSFRKRKQCSADTIKIGLVLMWKNKVSDKGNLKIIVSGLTHS